MNPAEANPSPARSDDRYPALVALGRALAGLERVDKVCSVLAAEIARALPGGTVWISLHDPETDEARVVTWVPTGGRPATGDVVYRGSDSEVIRSGRALVLSGETPPSAFPVLPESSAGSVASAIAAPLACGREVQGAVCVQSDAEGAYDEADLSFLEAVAAFGGIAVAHARHVATLERRWQEAEDVEAAGRALLASLDPTEVIRKVVGACLSVVEADSVAIWLSEETGDLRAALVARASGEDTIARGTVWDLEPLRAEVGGSRSAQVLTDLAGTPLADSGRESDPARVAMVAPLVMSRGWRGLVSMTRGPGRTFTDAETDLLERLATQAALAIENAQLHATLTALSLTDPLTGLANARHLGMHVDREVAAARRGRPIAVVAFELDDFAQHVKEGGEDAGDAIVKAFAGVLARVNRAMNLVARPEGGQFVSVLSEAREDGTQPYVDRLESVMGGDPVLAKHRVGATWGVAMFDRERMESGAELLEAAWQACRGGEGRRIQAG